MFEVFNKNNKIGMSKDLENAMTIAYSESIFETCVEVRENDSVICFVENGKSSFWYDEKRLAEYKDLREASTKRLFEVERAKGE